MSTREIVTLQIGHYSNFVGTHWWNLQESSFIYDASLAAKQKDLNHDVLFREGRTQKGEVTYTPRLVAVDLKGSLNTLKQEGVLYDTSQQEEVKWPGDVTLHQTASGAKNPYLLDLEEEEQDLLKDSNQPKVASIEDVEMKDENGQHKGEEASSMSEQVFGKKFYNLDNHVKVWSDYLRVYLHPKTIKVIEQYTMNNTVEPFDIYGAGEEVVKDYDTWTEIEDRIHYFTEECDHLQGFHVLLDTHDGFGGVGTRVLEHLEDEFSSKGIMTFGFTPADLPDNTAQLRANRILNSVLAYGRCSAHSSLFFPLSLAQSLWKTLGPSIHFPHLEYKAMDYHTSAILAATLESSTSAYRKSDPTHIRDITDNFRSLGKQVASLSTSIPFAMEAGTDIIGTLQSLEEELPWMSVTPHVKNSSIPFMQSVVMRGICSEVKPCSNDMDVFNSCRTIDDVLQVYLMDKFSTCLNAGCVVKEPCKVTTPFPHIFQKFIDKDGFLSINERPQFEGVESVATMTSMQSTKDISNLLNTLHAEGGKLNIKKHHRYLEAGLEEDEYHSIISDLNSLSQCYTPSGDMG